jgi:hypothetical protein
MSLSRLDERLTSGNLYPDRVVIVYRYNIPRCSSQTFANVLATQGFRRESRFHGYRRSFEFRESASPTNVAARRAGPTIGFYVPINVLSLLHREETRDFREERSRTDNWLHPDAVENSEPVWQRLYQQIIEHELHMADLAHEVAAGISPSEIATIQHIRVNRIELCADFGTQNPQAVMRMMAPRFKERFSRVRFQCYGEVRSASWSGELYHECNSIRGFSTAGVSFKLYEKTNRRVRLEVEYTRDGLCRRGAPISISDEMDGQEIAPLRNFLSQHCLPYMNDVLERAQPMTEDHRSVYQLLSRAVPLFSRCEPEELQGVFRALVLDRRITSQSLPYRKLAQLRDAGVLVATNRGVYGIAPEYEVTFRILRSADTIWQRRMARASEALEPGDLEWSEAAE